jgi:hypothetical protein
MLAPWSDTKNNLQGTYGLRSDFISLQHSSILTFLGVLWLSGNSHVKSTLLHALHISPISAKLVSCRICVYSHQYICPWMLHTVISQLVAECWRWLNCANLSASFCAVRDIVVGYGNKSLTFNIPCRDPIIIKDSELSTKPDPVTMPKGLMSTQHN